MVILINRFPFSAQSGAGIPLQGRPR